MTKEEIIRAKLDTAIAKLVDDIDLCDLHILGQLLLELGSALDRSVKVLAKEHDIECNMYSPEQLYKKTEDGEENE